MSTTVGIEAGNDAMTADITVHTRVVETALSEPASGFLKFIAKTEPNVAKIP